MKRIAILSEDTSKYRDPSQLARNATVHERDELESLLVQGCVQGPE